MLAAISAGRKMRCSRCRAPSDGLCYIFENRLDKIRDVFAAGPVPADGLGLRVEWFEAGSIYECADVPAAIGGTACPIFVVFLHCSVL